MFFINSLRAQHNFIHDTLTTSSHAGLKLFFSHFDGYSPKLDGSIRIVGVDSSDSKKSGSITTAINVKASSPLSEDNIRIRQQNNEISISTGGLSLPSYIIAPRLTIDIVISLPRSIGDLEIKTLSLPIFIQTVEKAGDVVITSHSAPISIASVEARSLTVSSHSGSITFEDLSEQHVDKFIKITDSSGRTKLGSSLFSPSVIVKSSSGSLGFAVVTTATELKFKNSSGSIVGDVEYTKDVTSISTYENNSGSLNIKLKGWTGFLTADTSSGSKHVEGRGLEKWNDGWKKGDGASKALFTTQSGSIRIEAL